jgi:hemerythrin-like domain-containing protein
MMTSEFDVSQNERVGVQQLAQPLKFIIGEHQHQLLVCEKLANLPYERDARRAAEKAVAVSAYLTESLPLHTEDEEKDLFPLLRLRCQPEDQIDTILDQLHAEHAYDAELVKLILPDLRAIVDGSDLSDPVYFRVNALAFCEIQRRHISWETNVVLPMARRRLSKADLTELGRGMMARRQNVVGGDLG